MKRAEAEAIIKQIGKSMHAVSVKAGKVAPEYHVLPESEELAVGMLAYRRYGAKWAEPKFDIAAQIVTAYNPGV